MDRADIVSGSAFRAVLRSCLIFLLLLVPMAVFSVVSVDQRMTEALREDLGDVAEELAELAEAQGLEAVETRVDHLARISNRQPLAIALFAADGARLAGNIQARPAPGTWMIEKVGLDAFGDQAAQGAPQRMILQAFNIRGATLVIGRNMKSVHDARAAMIRAFALTGFLVVMAMLLIGFFLSRESQAKLEQIEDTLDRVSQGDTTARIGVTGGTGQIERISRRIDARLDALDDMVQSTRRSSASIAHDLRRPLARATLSLERALNRAEAGGDVRGDIEDAQHDLARLTTIIGTILRIARIEGGIHPPLAKVDLRALLDDLAETFQPVAEDVGQSLHYSRPDGPVPLAGDADMLAQMVVNLIQNAISHAGDGARISVSTRSAPTGAVVLEVSDNGPGIPKDARDDVFEPFFRNDASRTVEGSGLGLPLVKAIATRHGASITLGDAAPGLVVRITFPVASVA